jgi:hypothetical protein
MDYGLGPGSVEDCIVWFDRPNITVAGAHTAALIPAISSDAGRYYC